MSKHGESQIVVEFVCKDCDATVGGHTQLDEIGYAQLEVRNWHKCNDRWKDACHAAGITHPEKLPEFVTASMALLGYQQVIETHGEDCPHCLAIKHLNATLAALKEAPSEPK